MTDLKSETKSIKVVLGGDGGVGKTTLIKKLRTGEFEKRYRPTMGCESSPLKLFKNLPEIHHWDTAGQEKYCGLDEAYYLGADVVILMFDVTSRISYKNVIAVHLKKVQKTCPQAKVIICGNKCDSKDRKINRSGIQVPDKLNIPYLDISAKTGEGVEELYRKIYEVLGYTETPETDTERKLFKLEVIDPVQEQDYDELRDELSVFLSDLQDSLNNLSTENLEYLNKNPNVLLELLG